jgi:hypothetical protein
MTRFEDELGLTRIFSCVERSLLLVINAGRVHSVRSGFHLCQVSLTFMVGSPVNALLYSTVATRQKHGKHQESIETTKNDHDNQQRLIVHHFGMN